MTRTSSAPATQRFYALDWLRSSAFILLLWIHSAYLFTNFGWHLKLQVVKALQEFIHFCSPWRMSLIFLVSGASLSFSFNRRGPIAFLKSSSNRLIYPLLTGLALAIPPVLYFERLDSDKPISLGASYLIYVQNFMHGNFRWLHLWYLGYLLAFCFLVAVVWPLWANRMEQIRQKSYATCPKNLLKAVSLSIPIMLSEWLLRPHYPIKRNFVSDLASICTFFIIFNYGATFIRNKSFVAVVSHYRWVLLICACLSYSIYRALLKEEGPIFQLISGLNLWLWILFFLGIAGQYFDRKISWVESFNEIVFPFYIVHQIIILAIAYWLNQLIPDAVYLLYASIVALSSGVCYLVIKVVLFRMPFLYRFVGIKPLRKSNLN